MALSVEDAFIVYSNFQELLNFPRQVIVVNMLYNLGRPRYLGFVNHIRFVRASRWDEAADEMIASVWCRQTQTRCQRMTPIMRYGNLGGTPPSGPFDFSGFWGVDEYGINPSLSQYRIVSALEIPSASVGSNISLNRYLYNQKNSCAYYKKSKWSGTITAVNLDKLTIDGKDGNCNSASNCVILNCEAIGEKYEIVALKGGKVSIQGEEFNKLETPQVVPDIPFVVPPEPIPRSNLAVKFRPKDSQAVILIKNEEGDRKIEESIHIAISNFFRVISKIRSIFK